MERFKLWVGDFIESLDRLYFPAISTTATDVCVMVLYSPREVQEMALVEYEVSPLPHLAF